MSRSLWIVAGFALVVGACGSSKVVDKLEGFADEACACADAACAEKVQAEFQAWAEANRAAKGSDDDRKRAEKALERFAKCMGEKLPAGGAAAPAPAGNIAEPPSEQAAPSETVPPSPSPAEPAPSEAPAKTEPPSPAPAEPAATPE